MTTGNLIANANSPVLAPNVAIEQHGEEKTILLAEDDGALRRFLEITLQRYGFKVVTARDGLEAMSKLASFSFCAIVTDGMMPQMTGHELCRRVRRNQETSNLPVIILSGMELEEETDPLSEEKADVYLCKPVSPAEITQQLERLFARNPLSQKCSRP
jgi:DNA-binding response OmpR family regulator